MSERRCFRCGEILDTNKCDTETISDPVVGVLIRHLLKDDCINSLRITVSQQDRLTRENAELREKLDGANALTRLENWKAAEKCRSVRIDIDDGYGATCWECVLRRRIDEVRCVESTREHGERIEKDGNLFIRAPATDGDWSGLEAVINCAIDAAEEFWKGAT